MPYSNEFALWNDIQLACTADTSWSHQHGLEIRPGMVTINGRIKRIVGTMQSIGTFFRVHCCALWCTSRTYIKNVTIAMRDIDSGRPNIALLTEFVVCLNLYVWCISRSRGKYELVANSSFQLCHVSIGKYEFICCA